MPKVSVIIPTYNSAKYLPYALLSVLRQSLQDYEILLIDDGSTDNTQEIVGHFNDNYPDKIRYVFQANQGLAGARNTGLKHAVGEFLALLDADDIWLHDRLRIQVEFLEKNSEYSFAFADVVAMDMEGRLGKTMMRLKRPASGNIFFELLSQNFISVPTMLMRRCCISTVGGYATDLKLCEDHHFNLRLAHYFKGKYIDMPLACYRIRRDSLSSSHVQMRLWDLKVIDLIQGMFPERYDVGKKYFDKARSNLSYELGYIKYRQNKFVAARDYFKKSFYLCKTLSALKSLLVTSVFPAGFLQRRNATIPSDETGLFS